MKKVIVVVVVLAIVLVATFLATRLKREEPMREKLPFNLTEPEKQVITIDGEEYSFLLSRYDPPYFHTRLLASREEQDLSTPERADLALVSAWGRDRDWYLSLVDEDKRELLLRRDKETGGKTLKEYRKGEPLVASHKTGNYTRFILKVELEFEGRKYAIIQYRLVHEGKEYEHPVTTTFVKQGDVWLGTHDLWGYPVGRLLRRNSYEEIREILKEGTYSLK